MQKTYGTFNHQKYSKKSVKPLILSHVVELLFKHLRYQAALDIFNDGKIFTRNWALGS